VYVQSHINNETRSNYHLGSGHQSPGLWRHPEDESHKFNDIDHWVELAQLLEAAKFHGIFIADVLGKLICNRQGESY
jgi:alkanesulfonate monooxygenase SsuD/methylene tetrahydromethanopterin reductase-like flavin-dependent oxidoreductase (luciferase family)